MICVSLVLWPLEDCRPEVIHGDGVDTAALRLAGDDVRRDIRRVAGALDLLMADGWRIWTERAGIEDTQYYRFNCFHPQVATLAEARRRVALLGLDEHDPDQDVWIDDLGDQGDLDDFLAARRKDGGKAGPAEDAFGRPGASLN